MLTEDEQRARAAQVTKVVGRRCRVVWQEPTEEWPERPRGYGVAFRAVLSRGPCEVAVFVDEADEMDDACWSRAGRALRMALDCEEEGVGATVP